MCIPFSFHGSFVLPVDTPMLSFPHASSLLLPTVCFSSFVYSACIFFVLTPRSRFLYAFLSLFPLCISGSASFITKKNSDLVSLRITLPHPCNSFPCCLILIFPCHSFSRKQPFLFSKHSVSRHIPACHDSFRFSSPPNHRIP